MRPSTPPEALPRDYDDGGAHADETGDDNTQGTPRATRSHVIHTQLTHDANGPLTGFDCALDRLLFGPVDQESWNRFEQLLDDIVTHARTTLKIRMRAENTTADGDANVTRPRRSPDPGDAKTIQRLYRINRRRAIDLVTGKTRTRCDIP